MEVMVRVLDERRKANFKVFNENKTNGKYDLLELNSKNMYNSKKIDIPFSAFSDIVGDKEKSIEDVKIHYQLLNGNNDKNVVLAQKINDIYDTLKENIDILKEKTEESLDINYKIKKENNGIAILQMYNDYEIDKKIIPNEYHINREIFNFQTSRQGIGEKLKENAEKEMNYIKEIINGTEKNELFRVRSTFLPRTNTTVFMIDEKRFDLKDLNNKNQAKPYWVTKQVLTDKELLENLSVLKIEKKKEKDNLELNKNLNEKDIGNIINFIENDKIKELLNDERYFKIKKENGRKEIIDIERDYNEDKNSWKKTAILGAVLIINSFANNNLKKNNNGEYSYQLENLENTKYYKRALNIINDFQKSEMEFETFIEKPTFSKIGLISAYSISQIDNLEKEKAININQKYLDNLDNNKTYLDKFYFFNGAINEQGERTDHIKGLNIAEILIDLNDGNTSEDQRKMLELQLLELTEKEKKDRELQEKMLKEAYEKDQETLNKTLITIVGLGLGYGRMSDHEFAMEMELKQKSANFYKFIEDILNNDKGFLPKSLSDLFNPEELEDYEFNKNFDIDEITDDKIIKFMKDSNYQIGDLSLSKTQKGIELKNHSADKTTKELVESFDGSEEPKGIAEIMVAMAMANQNRIDYDNSKREAILLNIDPSGDVYTEFSIMANSPEKIYLEGMSKINSQKEKKYNIYENIIEKDNLKENNNGNTKIEREVSKKVVEQKLLKVPTSDISAQLNETFKVLRQDQLRKEIEQTKLYQTLEKIEKGEYTTEKKADFEKVQYSDDDFQRDRYNQLNKKKDEKEKEDDGYSL